MKRLSSSDILDTHGLLRELSQHPVLSMVVASPRIQLRSPERTAAFPMKPRRFSAYLLLFMIDGSTSHHVDMETIRLDSGQLLFIRPDQIHLILSGWEGAKEWYKIAFDEDSLALLPQTFRFLANPYGNPIIKLSADVQGRLIQIFESLAQILTSNQSHSASLVLAYLNLLLTELTENYFSGKEKTNRSNGAMELYLSFNQLVDRDFALQPPVQNLAKELSVSENKLDTVVRQFAGISPGFSRCARAKPLQSF